MQRVASGLLGVVSITAGVAVTTLAGLGFVIGPLLAGAGANALCRGVAGRGVIAQQREWSRRRSARQHASAVRSRRPAA